jgi:hypothetical protein
MQQMKQNNQLNEHLSENDLKWLVDDCVLIDMHKTKLGEDRDYIVLSIAVNDRTPAHDLARFVENGVYKYEDVEVSPATDNKGRYLVYIEMKRDSKAFESINGILTDSNKLTGIEQWKFKTMGASEPVDFDQEHFNQLVTIDPVEYDQRHPQQEAPSEVEPALEPAEPTVEESIKSRLKFLMNY